MLAFYEPIGYKTNMKTYSRDFFVKAGRRGGLTTLKRRGKKYMGKISLKGGKANGERIKRLSTSEGIDIEAEGV